LAEKLASRNTIPRHTANGLSREKKNKKQMTTKTAATKHRISNIQQKLLTHDLYVHDRIDVCVGVVKQPLSKGGACAIQLD
jgi:hypothetical protein